MYTPSILKFTTCRTQHDFQRMGSSSCFVSFWLKTNCVGAGHPLWLGELGQSPKSCRGPCIEDMFKIY